MFAFLEGTVEEKQKDALVLNVGGVGFLVRTNPGTMAAAGQRGERFRVHTVLVVREDSMEVFGFGSREELQMFNQLTGISGVGPRTALGLLSALSARDIAIAVATNDTKTLSRAPGIGAKTAQRMVLELKDRITQEDMTGPADAPAVDAAQGSAAQEAILALVALGYSGTEAANAVQAVRTQASEANQLVLLALRKLGGGA